MKKHTLMLLSASALLTVNAFAPQIFWDNNKVNGRFPSSIEEDRLEKLEQDKKEELKKNEATVQCLKEDKSTKLEDEVKKLMADKEAILKELKDLKQAKKDAKKEDASEDQKEDDKKDDKKKDKKDIAKGEQQDVLGIMSQLTSLMMSQQEQQMMMMDQMFSMMQSMQRPQYQRQSPYDMFSPVSSYMSPYAYNHNSFNNRSFSQYSPYGEFADYPMMGNIGINYSQAMDADYDYRRTPSNEGQKFERGYFQPEAHNMQSQTPVPHDGFDFGATSLSGFNRVRFE